MVVVASGARWGAAGASRPFCPLQRQTKNAVLGSVKRRIAAQHAPRGPLQLNGALKMRLRHANRPVQRYILPARPPDCRRRRRASTKLIMKTLKMRGGTVAQRRPLHKLLRRRCALAIASSASLVAAVVAAVQVVPLPVQCDGSDGLGAAFRSSLHARL